MNELPKEHILIGKTLKSMEEVVKEAHTFAEYLENVSTEQDPNIILHEFAKTRSWGFSDNGEPYTSDLKAILACYYKESELFPWSEREKQYNEINHKRWSNAKNLGKGKGIPEGWTLCDIGPQNAFIELDKKAIRKRDEGDVKGFGKYICSLITPQNLEYIFTNTEVYNEF